MCCATVSVTFGDGPHVEVGEMLLWKIPQQKPWQHKNKQSEWLLGFLLIHVCSCFSLFQKMKKVKTFSSLKHSNCTYEHGSSCSDFRPVALKKLNNWDVIKVQHARKVLNLGMRKESNIRNSLKGRKKTISWKWFNDISCFALEGSFNSHIRLKKKKTRKWAFPKWKLCLKKAKSTYSIYTSGCLTYLISLSESEKFSLVNPYFTTKTAFGKVPVWLCAAHQVLGEVVDELSVVQGLVIVEVVLEHGRNLLWSHHRGTNSHGILTRLFEDRHRELAAVVVVVVCQANILGMADCTLTTCGFGSTRCSRRLTRTLWIWSLNTCSPEPNLDKFPMR